MKSIHVAALPELRIQAGSFGSLPQLIAERGFRRIGIVHGRSVYRDRGSAFESGLNAAGISFVSAEVSGEPGPGLVDAVSGDWSGGALELIVAIGGGSVIDAGKAVAAMLAEGEGRRSVKEYLEGVGSRTPSGRTLPLYALPTTAGTGSEATKNAVISEIGSFKKSLRHDNYIPKLALIDAELALGLPDEVTRASGLDAITQLLEAYISTGADPFTEALALSGLQAAGGAFETLIDEPRRLEARESMGYAAYLSGVCLANAGLGLIHGAASPLGAARAIPHGLVCGRLLPGVMGRIEAKAAATGDNSLLRKLALAAESLGAGGDSLTPFLQRLLERTELPGFRSYGFDEALMEELAPDCGVKNSPVSFDTGEIEEILKESL